MSDCVTVRLLREELQLLQESGSYVGEVVKAMDKKKVLVKVFCLLHIFCYIMLVTVTNIDVDYSPVIYNVSQKQE